MTELKIHKKMGFLGRLLANIGSAFLDGCIGLKELNLSALSNVTNIEFLFLSRSTGLTMVIEGESLLLASKIENEKMRNRLSLSLQIIKE